MRQVETLWDDAFAPITWSIGFLRLPFDAVVDGLASWRKRLHSSVSVSHFREGLHATVLKLLPITVGTAPRELVVATSNPEWTALFDCAHLGADQVARIGALSSQLKAQGLAVVSAPTIVPDEHRGGRYGALKFEMFGPLPTDFLNYVRAINLVEDEGRYHFSLTGTPQDFEDLEAYRARRVLDRFTPEMLTSYCEALGLRPWDETFYPGPSAMIESIVLAPPGLPTFTLEEERRWPG